jgi:hypothetical protein
MTQVLGVEKRKFDEQGLQFGRLEVSTSIAPQVTRLEPRQGTKQVRLLKQADVGRRLESFCRGSCSKCWPFQAWRWETYNRPNRCA